MDISTTLFLDLFDGDNEEDEFDQALESTLDQIYGV